MNIVICGRGRLATLIAQQLKHRGHEPHFARLDRERGLIDLTLASPLPVHTFISCFVPKPSLDSERSPWRDLFNGLQQQINLQQISIENVLHISSTAVYENCANGWCDANSILTPLSERAQGLLDAERAVAKLAKHSCVVRLTGLIGPGYERYDPLAMSATQLRHAVDIRGAAALIAQRVDQRWKGHQIELMTDGRLYFHGHMHDLEQHPELSYLLQHYRVFRPSLIAR